MIFYCIGIDQRKTSFEVREQALRKRQALIQFLSRHGEATALLFTCNRMEIYGIAQEARSVSGLFVSLQREFAHVFAQAYVTSTTDATLRHALRLSCGLYSQILGEEEIMYQLSGWIEQDNFPASLWFVWKDILQSANLIRQECCQIDELRDIADIVLEDLEGDLGSLAGKEIVVVGTGKLAQLFSQKPQYQLRVHFVSRKRHSRARALARRGGGQAFRLDQAGGILRRFHVLISATGSPHYVIREDHLKGRGERSSPLRIYDLAIPRDVDPRVAHGEGIVLRNLDDLAPLFHAHSHGLYRYKVKVDQAIDDALDILNERFYAIKDRDTTQYIGAQAS